MKGYGADMLDAQGVGELARSRGRLSQWVIRAILTVALVLTMPFSMDAPHADSNLVQGRASVIDGDTIEVQGQGIRLWGVDAPERWQPCYLADGADWRCGQEAAFALADWLGARPLCQVVDVDRYKRLVAVCEVEGDQVSAWLVRHGWALDYERYSHGQYADEQRLAQEEKLGVWQGEFVPPWEWRRKK